MANSASLITNHLTFDSGWVNYRNRTVGIITDVFCGHARDAAGRGKITITLMVDDLELLQSKLIPLEPVNIEIKQIDDPSETTDGLNLQLDG